MNAPVPAPKPTPGPTPSGQPLGVVVDRYGRDAGVADLFLGAQAFFVASGPSALTMPLDLLAKRGCLIMACNNSPAVLPPGIRPTIWTHTDPTHKFHDSIWLDPGIPLKLSPIREWGAWQNEAFPRQKLKREGELKPLKGLRTRYESGHLGFIPRRAARDCPGVLGYHRNTTFNPEAFLTEPTINRGNRKEDAARNGWPHCINTMFTVLRLAYYLGIRTLYLVGVDFRMDARQPYAFNQGKGGSGVRGNNHTYANMALMLMALTPKFDAAGFRVVNCTPGSNLAVFESMAFQDAIHAATEGFEQVMNCDGWYDPRDYRSYRPDGAPTGH